MNDSLHSYLISTIKEKEEHIVNMEKYAQEHHVPIMEPLGIEFLLQLIRISKPKRILEIGTAIGYSAIRMAEAYEEAHIVTIERDNVRYEQAILNIENSNLANRIEVIKDDAFDAIDTLGEKGPYDFLFIDAAKGQYKKFFETFTPFLNEEGIIISDNVLFRGYVAEEVQAETSRLQKIANKVRNYNDWLFDQANFVTTIVPIGDGIAITVKK